jgi:hypothetical protein
MKLQTLFKLTLMFILLGPSVVNAQDSRTSPTPVPMSVTRAWRYGNENKGDVGFRDRVVVEVEHLAEAIQRDKINPRDFVLYLDGQSLKDIKAVTFDGPQKDPKDSSKELTGSRLGFDLVRTEQSDPVWRRLLGSPQWREFYRPVTVSVGLPDKEALRPSDTSSEKRPVIYLRLYNGLWALIALAFLILIVFFFVRRARKGGFIRDSDPPKPKKGEMKPYSLALTQAAWWFFLVLGSFCFIYLVTGDYNSMTDQALMLMGIGTGTALGAFMINATKRDTADTQLNTLRPERARIDAEVGLLAAKETELKNKIAGGGTTAADDLALRDNAAALREKQAKLNELDDQIADAASGLTKPSSAGFKKDLLTDVNGITLHRFQMVVWTIVLGVIFLISVYRDLAMPKFSMTLLALMGISAVTYLGFKIPERQTDPKDEAKPK